MSLFPSFSDVVEKTLPSPKKLTPSFVRDSDVLMKMSSASLAHRAIRQNYSIATAPDWGDTKAMRANLREQHELQTSPSSKTSDMIRRRDTLPVGDPERGRLTAQINAATLRRGKVGIAVGATVVGGTWGAAIAKGGAIVTRENPTPNTATGNAVDTWPDPSLYPDPMQQMYARNPDGSPLAMQREGGNPSLGGLVSSVVGLLWSILVPKAKSGANGSSAGFDPSGMRTTLPVSSPSRFVTK